MGKFQIVSDLHIETQEDVPSVESLIKPSAPVLILAGDIGRIQKYDQLKTFLKDVCKNFEIVIYVLGNHEYYRVNDIPDKSMAELLQNVIQIESEINNLYILNRRSVIIDDVCIVGCTLWSQALVKIPPFIVRIREMNNQKYNDTHKNDVRYINKMIRYCNTKNLKLLVLTHHCHTYLVLKVKKENDKFKSLYASNLDYLLDSKRIHTWVCGHNHCNFDFRTRNGTRLVSNQKGKVKDNITDYLLSKVITV